MGHYGKPPVFSKINSMDYVNSLVLCIRIASFYAEQEVKRAAIFAISSSEQQRWYGDSLQEVGY